MSRQQSPGSQSNNSKTPHAANGTLDGARGKLSVREAGRKGGLRVRELINRGRQVEARQSEQRPN
ncbi:hypothetical protein J7I44_04450 [Frateuria sp. MAH-13]|uniref:Em GEA1 (EM1) n=1 Tax=Frateuria flava TaxID=2821489 RepID=A0ABS4DKG8_9GAMM|nr:hypothetical protein [Frateuria flava]MBP1473537.1 hypothetical protein [Frateuria flava]